jgi:hypothetical protein
MQVHPIRRKVVRCGQFLDGANTACPFRVCIKLARVRRQAGVPGRNAAAAILKEFGTTLEEVVKRA